MRHAEHVGAVAVDIQVNAGIDRGPQGAVQDSAIQIDHHHRVGRQLVEFHTRGLDDDMSGIGAAPRYVSARPDDEPGFRQLVVLLADIALQGVQHHAASGVPWG